MNISFKIVLVLFCVVSQTAQSQFEQFYESWRLSHFTTASGLPSDVVDDIVENKNGLVWASTLSGIAWFDGYRWNKINTLQGLPEKHVTQMYAWKNNSILVLLDGKLYHGDTLRFKEFELGEKYKCNIVSMAPIDSETVVVLTNINEYPYLLISSEFVKPINLAATGRLFSTRNFGTFLAHAFGLFQINKLNTDKILTGCFIRTIAENANQEKVMIVDAPHDMIGVWEWNKNGTPTLSAHERLLPVRTIDISSKSNVIAVYETGEVHVRSKNLWHNLFPVPPQLLGTVFVKYDANDNLWVGTGKGLYLYKDQSTKWKWLKHDNFDLRNIVMEIFRDKDKNIWVGNSNGIAVHSANGDTKEISQIGNTKLGLVTGINQDNSGNIWISSGASFEGAFRWDGRKWKHFNEHQGLKCPRVHKIKKDRKGRLWFLGLGDNL